MRYAVLKVCQRHCDVSGSRLSITSDIVTTIQGITPLYFNEFTKKYAGIYECFMQIHIDSLINPWHACAARVMELGLCVCLCV